MERMGVPGSVMAYRFLTNPSPSLRGAKRRSNPEAASKNWIASSQELLAMTGLMLPAATLALPSRRQRDPVLAMIRRAVHHALVPIHGDRLESAERLGHELHPVAARCQIIRH